MVESTGGPTWYSGIECPDRHVGAIVRRSEVYVTRNRRGAVSRADCRERCSAGIQDLLALSDLWRFLGARTFQEGNRRRPFIDMADMGVDEDRQPDKFYFDQALKVFASEPPSAVADLHVRVSHGQSFSLVERLPAPI